MQQALSREQQKPAQAPAEQEPTGLPENVDPEQVNPLMKLKDQAFKPQAHKVDFKPVSKILN